MEVYDELIKALEEIEELKAEIEELNDDIVWWTNRFKAVERDNERLNNIINGMEKFFKYELEEEVRPLNDFKVSVWTICLDKLQELKGSDKE